MKSVKKYLPAKIIFLTKEFSASAKTKMPLRLSGSGIGEGESRLFFFGDLDFYFGGDFAEDFDLYGEIAEGF